jgi:hypothetical protein
MAQQPSGEFASTDPATGTQDARFQERRVSTKISLSSCGSPQHLQRPTSSHLGKNTPSLAKNKAANIFGKTPKVASTEQRIPTITVVVYKVDRLTRSLADFAKLDSLVYASNDVLAIMSRARLSVLLLQL